MLTVLSTTIVAAYTAAALPLALSDPDGALPALSTLPGARLQAAVGTFAHRVWFFLNLLSNMPGQAHAVHRAPVAPPGITRRSAVNTSPCKKLVAMVLLNCRNPTNSARQSHWPEMACIRDTLAHASSPGSRGRRAINMVAYPAHRASHKPPSNGVTKRYQNADASPIIERGPMLT